MTAPRPEPVRKIEIREANLAVILEAAERVFAIHGYKGATVEQIARQAGLPKPNVYYYFESKENLYRQVLARILDDWMAAAAEFDAHHEPEDALRAYVTAKMMFSRQRPCGSKVWASEIMSGAPVMEKFLGTTLSDWLDECVAVIHRWIEEGKVTAVNPRTLLYLIWATTQHYADFERQILVLNHGREVSDSEYRDCTDEVVRMVLRCVGL